MLTNKVPEKDVNDLFTRVAPNYDLMNNMVSLGIQNIWRKQFLNLLHLLLFLNLAAVFQPD